MGNRWSLLYDQQLQIQLYRAINQQLSYVLSLAESQALNVRYIDCYTILVETDKLNEQLAIKKLGEFIKLLTKAPPLKLEPKSLTRLLFF